MKTIQIVIVSLFLFSIPVNAQSTQEDPMTSKNTIGYLKIGDIEGESKTKGEMERDVQKQNIQKTFIFRPSLIGGEREERRTLEKIGLAIFKVIQPLFKGKLKQYKITEPENIAQAMINLANSTSYTEVIITSNDIKRITKNTK